MSNDPLQDEIEISPATIISAMTGTFAAYHQIRQQLFREISYDPHLYALVILGLIRLPVSSLTHRFIDVLNNLPLDNKNAGNAAIEKTAPRTVAQNGLSIPILEPKKTQVSKSGKASKKSKKRQIQPTNSVSASTSISVSNSVSNSASNSISLSEVSTPSSLVIPVNLTEEALLAAFGCLFIHQIIEADRRFNRILHTDPKNIMALLGLASCARISHQNAKSLTLLERLNDLLPQNPFILNRMGMIYAELQQYLRAKAVFDQIFQLAPLDIFSHIDWAWYLIEQHEFDQAKQLLLRGLTMDPGEVLLYSGLGDAYSLQELAQESLTFYRQATELDDFNIQAWKNLGLTLMDLNQFEQAAQCFSKIEQLDKSRPDGNICFGWLLIAQEKYQEAIERFKLALKNDPQNGEIHLEISKCYEELGADPQQLQYLQLAVRFDTLNPEVHYALAEYYADHKRYQNAKDAYQSALKLNPYHVMSLNGLALLEYFEFEDLGSALNHFQQALAHDPKNVLTLFNMSEVYLDSGSIANAERTLKQILEIDPKDVNALYSLGVIAKDHLENYPTAEKYLLQVLEIDSTYVIAYMELIELYLDNKNFEKVPPLLEAMQTKFPTDPLAKEFIERMRQQVNRQRPRSSKP